MSIPKHLIDKIMLYNSHPTADIMRDLILKYEEVIVMRGKNTKCCPLSFYTTWCNIELDQLKINRMIEHVRKIKFDGIEFDF